MAPRPTLFGSLRSERRNERPSSCSSSTRNKDRPASGAKERPLAPILPIPQRSGAPGPSSSKAGLSFRRNLGRARTFVLAVNTNTKRDVLPSEEHHVCGQSSGLKTIRRVHRFADYYKLAGEVMPSTNAGMQVLFAKRLVDGLDVVVKTRKKDKSFCDEASKKDWRRNTEMLLNLPESESIARIFEVLEDEHTLYVVMERCEGLDLYELLEAEGKAAASMTKPILRELLRAVRDLHARGCIHKDLKLENIMVDPVRFPTSPKAMADDTPGSEASTSTASTAEPLTPTVKLIDFDTVETFCPKSKAKCVVGTDQYIAQEAYAGHYSPASDVFSCGVIAYRLISGRFPFKNKMFDDQPGENWVGSPKMKEIQDRLKQYHIDFESAPWVQCPEAQDLVRWMLSTNDKDRPTAERALEHPFLEETGTTPKLGRAAPEE